VRCVAAAAAVLLAAGCGAVPPPRPEPAPVTVTAGPLVIPASPGNVKACKAFTQALAGELTPAGLVNADGGLQMSDALSQAIRQWAATGSGVAQGQAATLCATAGVQVVPSGG
jgi:hypothetical protein